MDFSEMSLDDKITVAKMLESLQQTRQIAYECTLQMPEMRETFEAAEANYVATAELFNVPYRPVFNEEQYVEERVSKGDLYHTFVQDTKTRRGVV